VELYAMKYGESPLYETKKIYADMAKSEEREKFFWLYYVAKYNNKILLFDTGYRDIEIASKFGMTYNNIEKELKSIIGDYNNVDVIFLTHSHFDHIGNLDLYQKCSIVMSKAEYDIAIKECSKAVVQRLLQGDVTIVDDEFLYEDKFLFKVIGGHSPGSSVVYFKDGATSYVLTGDESYMLENMLEKRPVGLYFNIEKNLDFLCDANNKKLVALCFHDVNIFENYEHISKDVAKII
jgi:glyoxylase-like metal-dependent hydrolase (beta-lactamase superfamily II)